VPSTVLPIGNRPCGASPNNAPTHRGWISRFQPDELLEYDALERSAPFAARTTLFREEEQSDYLFRVVEGQIKISVNSSSGRRLAVAFAGPGELLDLASVITGHPHFVTTETLYPCVLARISTEKLNMFLSVRPALYEPLLKEMVAQYNVFCSIVRLIGLDTSVPRRLARLLLHWSESSGKKSFDGVRISVALTHEEIGEFVGASRESITRAFSTFRERHLVEIHGSTILIPDLANLALFATVEPQG
jgi:CRP/FNR family cyclic AMP-dependent transcriptional regulator